jgi:hypothetical protein
MEDWTEEDRASVLEQVNRVIAEHGVIVQPFTESIFDCQTCYAPAVMVYPDGAMYDSCFTVASVLRMRGLVSEEQAREAMYMGNVHQTDGFYMDVERKRALMKAHIDCPIMHGDIDVAVDRMVQGVGTVQRPHFRVMEVKNRNVPAAAARPRGALAWLRSVWPA